MYNRKAAGEIFHRYAEQYDMQNTLIRHKVVHTFRVAELCGRYAEALAMAGEDTDLAWLIGLMHDIGRFEQARRYGTFVDSLSVDHAELSADLLFAEGLADRFPQDGLPEDWRNIAETAVRQHNKLKPAETPDDRTWRFIDLIRKVCTAEPGKSSIQCRDHCRRTWNHRFRQNHHFTAASVYLRPFSSAREPAAGGCHGCDAEQRDGQRILGSV